MLLGGGVLVSVEAITRLGSDTKAPTIHWYELAVVGVALVLELSRMTVALVGARRYESAALRANALHFASDIGGSLVVLAGLLAVRAGVHDADSAGSATRRGDHLRGGEPADREEHQRADGPRPSADAHDRRTGDCAVG